MTIAVDPGMDDVTVRELFSPRLVAALADHPISWHQLGRDLVAWRTSEADPDQALEQFLQDALEVVRASWDDQD